MKSKCKNLRLSNTFASICDKIFVIFKNFHETAYKLYILKNRHLINIILFHFIVIKIFVIFIMFSVFFLAFAFVFFYRNIKMYRLNNIEHNNFERYVKCYLNFF